LHFCFGLEATHQQGQQLQLNDPLSTLSKRMHRKPHLRVWPSVHFHH
jgi:hypothetical protein